MLRRLEKEIIEKNLIQHHEKILVGVSGGPDSMALLYALHQLSPKYHWELFVVHVDHQLRGESGEDARYVKERCAEWGIPCSVQKADVNQRLDQEGGNLQAVARMLRYQRFEEMAVKWQIHKIALAHHADDQVETVLMRFIRGTGTAGLIGMNQTRIWKGKTLIRPLLSFKKEEIERYCEEEQLYPRIDLSNLSTNYTRNRIRIQLFPILNTYNPQFQEAVLQLRDIAEEEERVWQDLTQQAMNTVLKKHTTESFQVDIELFLQISIALQRRIIKLILNSLLNGFSDVTLDVIERIRKLALQVNPSGSVRLPEGYTAWREYQILHVSRRVDELDKKGSFCIELPLSGRVVIPRMIGTIEVIRSDILLKEVAPCKSWAVFDGDAVDFPLYARSRYNGDRMTCYGLAGTKKVKNVFIEEKIPQHLRDQYPVIVSKKDGILWIPGARRSNNALINQDTKQFLYLLWHI